MALFQQSVLNKYLKTLPEDKVNEAYQRFKATFQTEERIKLIRSMKEEEYQAGFLDDLFVKVLGYTLKPNDGFNIELEKKNTSNAKKADGAILVNNEVEGVIELKSTSTTDIRKIEYQAFGYKSTHPNCKYVITSNFAILRFYVNDTTSFEDFHLFDLTEERFKVLYLLLSWGNLSSGLPTKVKNESVLQEEEITKKLYKDYSHFKIQLFESIKSKNPQFDELLLFKKTQKLLDRFLFIFFAEDKGLLPPNSISRIIDRFNTLEEEDAYKPLYEIFQQYFGYIDKGREAKGKRAAIFAFNGGLFAPDEVLDNLEMSDQILMTNCSLLSAYDIDTEVDVNILGHIFEHSLNEIEEISAKIEGKDLDKNKTKRKKDGVFYTPKYITKYIVENTIGKLCEEKKTDLGLEVEEYLKDRKGRTKKKLAALEQQLQDYQDYLMSLRICDPACGSGAFLNQAFNFLIEEHEYIAFLRRSLFGESIQFDMTNDILEKNLYGVDINDESVDIAKLSLWLRTAKKGRTLASLNNNLKCGNSLIDDPNVAGEKAFDWEKEFPEVFANGGFDVVIGNPPYVDIKGLESDFVKVLFEKFDTTENRINLYSIFIEKGYEILKKEGLLSFINPNSILVNSSYTKIRSLLINDITSIIKLPDDVFPDAKVETIIFEFKKGVNSNIVTTLVYPKDAKIYDIDTGLLKKQNKDFWKESKAKNYNIYVSDEDISILRKCEKGNTTLVELADFTLGITPYDKYKGHSQEIIKNRLFHSNLKEDESYKPLISGGNIQRYFVSPEIKEYIKYGNWLGATREERFFIEPRILIRQIVSGKPPRIYAGYTDESYYFTQIGFGIIPKNKKVLNIKYLLGLLNSKLITYYHKYKFLDLEKELFQKILIANCKQLPIKIISKELDSIFVSKVDSIIKIQKDFWECNNDFFNYLKAKYDLSKVSKKMAAWHTLDAKAFLAELKEAKVKLEMKEEMELLKLFKEEQSKAQSLQATIDQTDKEIDNMVYALYGLTDEEIKIVEAN